MKEFITDFLLKRKKGKIDIVTFISNDFIRKILTGYMNSIRKSYTIKESLFILLFEKSFNTNLLPNKVSDFSYSTFKSQFDFYDYIEKTLGESILSHTPLYSFLIAVYIYIARNYDFNIFHDSWISIDLLNYNSFPKFFRNGYRYILYSSLEKVPQYDKWWLNPNYEISKSVAMCRFEGFLIDFTVIKNSKYVYDMKNYFWNGPGVIYSRVKNRYALFMFLEYKFQYDKDNAKVYYLCRDFIYEFPYDLIWNFKIDVKKRYSSQETRAGIFKIVKSFILFISNKYKIDKKSIQLLSNKYDDIESGNPITKKDFDLILNEFKKLVDFLPYGDLLCNIFILASTSKLRLGEVILELESYKKGKS